MRRVVGIVVAVGGIAAFAAVIALLPTLLTAGRTVGSVPIGPPADDAYMSDLEFVVGVHAHDLRIAALVVVACGLVLALVPSSWSLRGPALLVASVLAAGTVPALAWDVAEYPSAAGVLPVGYLVVLRGVEVLLIVAAVAAALAAGPGGRTRSIAACAAGGGLALAAGFGLVSRPEYEPVPVLAAVLAAAVLLISWRSTGVRQFVTAGVVLVLVPFVFMWVVIGTMWLSVASLLLTGTELGADGLPFIGAGLGMGLLLVVAYLLGRSQPAMVTNAVPELL